jgi:hypothetical protein
MKPRTSIILLVLTSLCSFVAGFIGFGGVGEDYSIATRAYLALQLFTFQAGDVEGSVPLGVEIGRWLAPASTLGGVYAAAHAFFSRLWGTLRLRWIRGHTIICGGGTRGSALAEELARRGRGQVVLVDPMVSVEIAALRRRGVLVVHGSGGDAGVMERAGLARAARLVCITGDDRTNIGMALAAADSLPSARVAEPLEIHAHMAEVARRNILQRSQLLDMKHDPRHRIRLFSCHANRARLALERHPLEWDKGGGLHDEVHLVVGSLGPLEKALVVHAAHIGHFRHAGKVRLHLVSVSARADEAALIKEYPGLRHCALLDTELLGHEDEFVERVAELARPWGANSLVTVLSGGAPEAAMGEALLLGERLKNGPRLRVLLDAPGESGVRSLIGNNPQLATWIRFLPDLLDACGSEVVFSQRLDVVARRIHTIWKEGTDQRIREAEAAGNMDAAAKHRAKATYRDWVDLTEEQKDVNRLAADHIPVKIRAVGLDPDAGPSLHAAWAGLDARQLDMLCRMEHERWAAPLWMAGWTPGIRDDSRRIHDNLVPYDELNEGTRKYDLEQVEMAVNYRFPHTRST